MGVGGIAGKYIGDRVEPTSLPQVRLFPATHFYFSE